MSRSARACRRSLLCIAFWIQRDYRHEDNQHKREQRQTVAKREWEKPQNFGRGTTAPPECQLLLGSLLVLLTRLSLSFRAGTSRAIHARSITLTVPLLHFRIGFLAGSGLMNAQALLRSNLRLVLTAAPVGAATAMPGASLRKCERRTQHGSGDKDNKNSALHRTPSLHCC